jgi:hypothetical protein
MMHTNSADPACKMVVVKQIDRGRYKLSHPIRAWSIEEPDGSFSAFIHELEILSRGVSADEALFNAFSEMLLLYELITQAPLSSVFNEEVLFYRYFLNSHIIKV